VRSTRSVALAGGKARGMTPTLRGEPPDVPALRRRGGAGCARRARWQWRPTRPRGRRWPTAAGSRRADTQSCAPSPCTPRGRPSTSPPSAFRYAGGGGLHDSQPAAGLPARSQRRRAALHGEPTPPTRPSASSFSGSRRRSRCADQTLTGVAE
jgi:hypothetical protein